MASVILREVDIDDLRRELATEIIDKLRPLLAAPPASRASEFASRKELAEIFRVSESSIDRWVKDGCPSLIIGKNRCFIVDEVTAWARNQTPKTT